MELSKHSRDRAQQRGIAPMVIDLLLRFGTREHDGRGAEIVYFDRKARRRLSGYAGNLIGKLDGQLDVYAVVANDKVITSGFRFRRINRR